MLVGKVPAYDAGGYLKLTSAAPKQQYMTEPHITLPALSAANAEAVYDAGGYMKITSAVSVW